MNNYLLIGLESLIDHIGCIRDLGIAYWKKANKKMQIGDIVYLFISDIEHNRVMYRLEVVDVDSVRDDKKYWRGTYKHDTSCFKLRNTSGVYHGEGLDHDDLEKHGISRYVQYKKLNKEQAEWLEKHFVQAMYKKTIIFLLGIFSLFACNNVQQQQSKSGDGMKLRTLDSMCIAYIESHLDGFNNEITRERTAKEIQRIIIDTLTSNSNLLYDLPLQYESVVDDGNKFIVRFSTGYRYQWTDRKICKIDMWFYSKVDEEVISKLKDKGTYYLSKAKFMGRVNDKIELPNGDTFDHNPHVALIESPLDTTFMIGLGGLYVKDIELKE